MPRDINDVYTLPAGNPVIPGTVIDTNWANTTLNDIAQALTDSLDKSDPAQARNVLGLGSAATKDTQTSTTDTTTGRLLLMGAFGLGTAGISSNNLDIIVVSGFYKAASSATGSPIVSLLGHNVYYQGDGSFGTMIAVGYDSAKMFVRRRQSGAWSAWLEVFSPIGANLVTSDNGSLGFGVGSGGTVTQATSKSTGVTLNKPTGRITMNNAALAAGASVGFTLTNSAIGANDTVNFCGVSGTGSANYRVETYNLAAGSVAFRVTNITAGSLSEALQINFSVIKGAIA